MRQSLRCSRLTKLITLQLHFLNTGHSTKLISLRQQDLPECIVSLPRFYQVGWGCRSHVGSNWSLSSQVP